jgi:hypothetical protein
MGLSILTLIHILISLAGIVSGLVVLDGWLAGKQFQGWTAFFLVTTVTTVGGFFFAFRGLTSAHGVGVISFLFWRRRYTPSICVGPPVSGARYTLSTPSLLFT